MKGRRSSFTKNHTEFTIKLKDMNWFKKKKKEENPLKDWYERNKGRTIYSKTAEGRVIKLQPKYFGVCFDNPYVDCELDRVLYGRRDNCHISFYYNDEFKDIIDKEELFMTEELFEKERDKEIEEYIQNFKSLSIGDSWWAFKFRNFADSIMPSTNLYEAKIVRKIINDGVCYVSYKVRDILKREEFGEVITDTWGSFQFSYKKEKPEYVEPDFEENE